MVAGSSAISRPTSAQGSVPLAGTAPPQDSPTAQTTWSGAGGGGRGTDCSPRRGLPLNRVASLPIHNPAASARNALPPILVCPDPGFHPSARPVSGSIAPMPRRLAAGAPETLSPVPMLAYPSGLSSHRKWPPTYTAAPVSLTDQTLSPPV